VEIQPKQPTAQGPAENFTGDVWFDVIAAGVPPSRLRVSTVRFSPARTRRGTVTPTGRRCTSPKAGDSSKPEAGR
jgi:hypothetical protein